MPDQPDTRPGTDAEVLPPRTTPTWEMELLLSGATVFALLQAYGWVAPRGVDVVQLAGLRLEPLLSPLLLYLQAGMLALAGGFLLHLILRGYWIALVGLRSVDPVGSLRESSAFGPWTRERIAAAWDALPERIAALDDRATVVFGLALGLARLMAQLFLYASLIVALSMVVEGVSAGRVPALAAAGVLVMLFMLPFAASAALDNRAGRLGRPTPRVVRGVLDVYDRLGVTPQHNLSLQFFIHRLAAGRGRARGVVGMFMLVLVLTLAANALPPILRGELGDRLRAGFPRLSIGDHATLRGVHYDDTASGVASRRLPSIPSARVEGDWLPLFIPWVDVWHADSFDACVAPHGTAWRQAAGSARAVLDCMAAQQPITLDGQPLSVAWHLADDPRRDRRGFLVMIDLRGLAAGPHELVVAQSAAARDPDEPEMAWRIPFRH